jgi:gas vesicle protein
MINKNRGYKFSIRIFLKLLVGMLMGSVAGAVVMLLLAPQSGKNTRKQIQHKGIELRDWTTDIVEDAMAQVSSRVGEITVEG